ncbi:Colicin V production protein [Amycolatopsis arida]|uniref:Colicin V production protein n=1 Tax=Amycolatopsis arida TaxID=587909 RepID=A0A1I5S659_9PSEU|nr:MarP family serine protease [Amycolatopsis arida]TDX85296.1 colicin V production protein [Amycolatopsis arida]SFP66212.1 Colicin V production protein [Amycolatopsis arida]
MNWVDVLVVLLAVLAALSGARQGVVIALPAFLGVILGAVAGIKVAPMVVELFENPAARVAFAVATMVFLVALGETLGVWVGTKVKRGISSAKLSGADSALGAIVQGAVVFVVAWIIALPLTSVAALPGLASAINNSTVLGGVNSVMPRFAHGLPNDLRRLLDESGLPSVLAPFQQAPITEIEPPDESLQSSPVVRQLRDSVVKIRGSAPSCSRSLEGSGFVVAPQRVMTNAHVVAGTDEVAVETTAGRFPARVVYYDPETDVAILAVPGFTAPPLRLSPEDAAAGDDAIVLGFPLDGPYTARPARVRQRVNLRGPDIYDEKTVQRDVYTVRGQVRSGNSGGPMVDERGRVVGVVFGASVEDRDTGFVLTADEVRPEIEAAPGFGARVSTGRCTS